MKSISFLIHGTSPRPVGGVKIIYQYANMFVKYGYDVTILFSESRKENESTINKTKYFAKYVIKKILRYHKRSWFVLDSRVKSKYIFDLSKENLNQYDVIIATMLSTSFHVAQIMNEKRLSAKCFYFVQDFEAWGVPESTVYKSYKLPLKKIAISGWLVERIKKVDENVICIPNGFDLNYFNLNVPIEGRNKFEISMLYHVDSRKRCQDSFEALEVLKRKYPQIHVNMFGAYSKPSNLPDWYSYIQMPNKESHNAIYNTSAIFINASAQEGWGLTVGEAMICGCAVVCSSNDGHRIMAKNNENALLFEVGNIDQIVKSIEMLLEDDNMRIRLAHAGNSFIQDFSWDNSVKKFIEVIEGEQ